jgi:hypothetical protein
LHFRQDPPEEQEYTVSPFDANSPHLQHIGLPPDSSSMAPLLATRVLEAINAMSPSTAAPAKKDGMKRIFSRPQAAGP